MVNATQLAEVSELMTQIPVTQGPLSGDAMMPCPVKWPENKVCGLQFKARSLNRHIASCQKKATEAFRLLPLVDY